MTMASRVFQPNHSRAIRLAPGFRATFAASLHPALPLAATLPVSAKGPRRKRQWPKLMGLMLVVMAVAIWLVNYYNVDKSLTDEDRHYVQLYLPGYPQDYAKIITYSEQIALVELVQRRMGRRTTGWTAIPEGQPREPKQLYEQRSGLCYDRSRVLEKIYLYLGFETRHLSLFTREPFIHSWQTLLFHHVPSHAISEVETKHGWLMVDPNDLWVSLDRNHEPVSMHKLQALYLRGERPAWEETVPSTDQRFYNDRCIPIYGLYSRHGRFYPPYTSGIPDFRVRGLLYNLEDN